MFLSDHNRLEVSVIPSLDVTGLLKQCTELREIPCSLDQFIIKRYVRNSQVEATHRARYVERGESFHAF